MLSVTSPHLFFSLWNRIAISSWAEYLNILGKAVADSSICANVYNLNRLRASLMVTGGVPLDMDGQPDMERLKKYLDTRKTQKHNERRINIFGY